MCFPIVSSWPQLNSPLFVARLAIVRLYQEWIDKSDQSREEAHQKAPGPLVTSEAIADAMTNPKPKTRTLTWNDKRKEKAGMQFKNGVKMQILVWNMTWYVETYWNYMELLSKRDVCGPIGSCRAWGRVITLLKVLSLITYWIILKLFENIVVLRNLV